MKNNVVVYSCGTVVMDDCKMDNVRSVNPPCIYEDKLELGSVEIGIEGRLIYVLEPYSEKPMPMAPTWQTWEREYRKLISRLQSGEMVSRDTASRLLDGLDQPR